MLQCSCPNIRKGSPSRTDPIPALVTIGVFRSPSNDSERSVYFPAEDPSLVIPGNQAPAIPPSLDMDMERILSLEQAISELQTRDDNTQQKLNVLIDRLTHIPRPTSPTPNPTHISDAEIIPPSLSAPPARGPPPALPSEFDGDRSRGQEFLRSCQTYIRLCSHSFPDDQISITWTLSYMKSGRAAKWAARVFRWEEENGVPRFGNWNAFRAEFSSEFCPAHSDISAINRLESTAYFQAKRSVDEYLDEFLDLITEAGYTDSKTIVVKFRRGLDSRLQDAIATMTSGRPSDKDPDKWYSAA